MEPVIDGKLAGKVEREALHRIKNDWESEVQKVCDLHDLQMRQTCEKLRDQFLNFRDEKALVFATLAKVEGESRARAVFDMGLEFMLPPSLDHILALVGINSIPTVVREEPSSERGYSKPMNSSTASIREVSTKATHNLQTHSFTKTPAQPRVEHLPPPGPEIPLPQGKSKATMPGRTIYDWEVQGSDFIFQYDLFGPGWFVVRCGHGPITVPKIFKFHPLENNRAMFHFNDKSCNKHDTTMSYKMHGIMKQFSYRVVSARGEDITTEWACESNEMLTEKLEASKKKKRKRTRFC